MRRLLAMTAIAVAVVAGAAPAWAHEEISPTSIQVGKPVFLAVRAANEKRVDLTKLTLTAPAGVDLGSSTRDPAGWTAAHTDTTNTWTGGAVKPGRFEEWGFEVEGADQPGTLTWKVTLGYSDGSTEDASVVVTATSGGSATGGEAGDDDAASTDGGSGKANVAIGLSAVALLGAVAAFAAGRRKSPAATTNPAPPAGGGQDW